MNQDFPVSELRLVATHYRGPERREPNFYVMHHSHVDDFVKAALELHYQPGINPHNGNACAVLESVYVDELRLENYWWATPGLNRSSQGPKLRHLMVFGMNRVWAHPDKLEEEKQARIEALKAELRAIEEESTQ